MPGHTCRASDNRFLPGTLDQGCTDESAWVMEGGLQRGGGGVIRVNCLDRDTGYDTVRSFVWCIPWPQKYGTGWSASIAAVIGHIAQADCICFACPGGRGLAVISARQAWKGARGLCRVGPAGHDALAGAVQLDVQPSFVFPAQTDTTVVKHTPGLVQFQRIDSAHTWICVRIGSSTDTRG